MNIHVSISIACYNSLDVTKKCCVHLLSNTPREGVEYLLTDNASQDGTFRYLRNVGLPNKTVLSYPENQGYQTAHNEALKLAKGRFFIVLNNDVYMKDPDWLMKLLDPLVKDEKVGIVGLKGNPSVLKPNGDGSWGEKLEYIDGSCFAARTEQLKQYGLFSPSLKMFFYEDSDLSLRFRQMGYKLEVVDIKYEHLRGTSVCKVDRGWVNEIRRVNEIVFKKRWNQYLTTRSFTNKILITAKSDGIGDILAMSSVLSAIRHDHPTAEITLETSFPDLFEKNPNVDIAVKQLKEGPRVAFDRVIDFTPTQHGKSKLNYASYKPLYKEVEEFAGTKVFSPLPEIYLMRQELDRGAKIVEEATALSPIGIVACLNLFTSHTFWEGRGWNTNEAKKLIGLLRESGCATIELGTNQQTTGEADMDLVDKLPLRDYFSVIANLKNGTGFLVTIDSLGLHVAQAFGTTTFALFGATEPISRVLDFSRVFIIRNEQYACLGCYQKKGSPDYNRCERKSQGCMIHLNAEYVFDHIRGKVDPHIGNLNYLYNYGRKIHEA